MVGIEPTANSTCDPSIDAAVGRVTSTPSAVRRAPDARDWDMTVMPRVLNTSSSSCAASASSPGSTRSRLDTSTTSAPSDVYAPANSAPVTPEPTTMSRVGSARQVVQLGPREDALAVGPCLGELAGGRAGGDEDDVGVEREVVGALRGGHDDAGRPVEVPVAEDDLHALALEARPDVRGLRGRERLDARVHRSEVDAVPQLLERAADGAGQRRAVEPDAQLGRAVRDGHPLGGRDERLGRDDVGQDGGATHAGGLDHGDVRPEPAADEGRLVASGPAADDDDARGGR